MLLNHERLHHHFPPRIFFYHMKDELVDIDAILSHATAELSIPSPDIAKIRAAVDQAREKILDLAEGLEDSQKN